MDAFQEAVTAGDTSQLKHLLQGTPYDVVNTPLDEEGTTLLHLGANSDSTTSLCMLLDHGANINWQNADGFTALHVAAIWGKGEAVRLLLEEGADPTICDEDNLLPVDHARNEGHTDCVQLLDLWGVDCEGGQGGSVPIAEMSMAETFVSMVMDDLTQVTQLTLTPDSPTLGRVLELSPATPPTPDSLPVSDASLRKRLSFNSSGRVGEDVSTEGSSPEVFVMGSRGRSAASLTRKNNGVMLSVEGTTVSGEESLCSELYTTAVSSPDPLSDTSTAQRDNIELLPELGDLTIRSPGIVSSNASASFTSGSQSPSDSHLDCSYAACITVTIPSSVRRLSNLELREKLICMGEQPGPITDLTRPVYLAYLAKLEAGGARPEGNRGDRGYKYELALVLNGTVPIPDFSSLEQEVFQPFRKPPPPPLLTSTSPLSTDTPRARDGRTKTHFNYLLLDPRTLQGLEGASRGVANLYVFKTFVESIFYVGKGKNARSLQHLKDAKECLKQHRTKRSSKLCRIMDIWAAGCGVVSLHMFYNTTAEEAFTREACMIDAVGLGVLTNIQRGHVYGEVGQWSPSRRRHFGVYLLHKALRAYLIDPPQQIYQNDL